MGENPGQTRFNIYGVKCYLDLQQTQLTQSILVDVSNLTRTFWRKANVSMPKFFDAYKLHDSLIALLSQFVNK